MTTEDNNARDQARAQLESVKEMVAALHSCAGDDEDPPEEAIQRIQEDPLSVEVRSGWVRPGEMSEPMKPSEFKILLCTGGPAVRIVGGLDEYYQPDSVRIQYQDWGTPWTDYWIESEEASVLVEYCQQFYFGG